MKFNVRKFTFECLKENPETRFTTREIAELIFDKYPEECEEKRRNSQARLVPLDDKDALIFQISAEIQPKFIKERYPDSIKTTEGRPRKFYYTKVSGAEEAKTAEDEEAKKEDAGQTKSTDKKKKNAQPELALHQKLMGYLLSDDPKVYTKRIDESRGVSKKKGANRWLYPDIVGLEVLSQDWISEIKACADIYSNKKARLWSFEIKVIVNQSNARDYFLQAVTNSSWAHFGYLVAREIGSDAMSELRILSNLHGIGVIELNADNPSESQVLIPAREKAEIDWNTANRLADSNDDFKEYIELVIEFHTSRKNKIKKQEWDGRAIEE